MPLGKSPVKRRKRDGTEEAERWCSCGGSLSNSMGGGGGGVDLELCWPTRYVLRCPQLGKRMGTLHHPLSTRD